jgi:Sec-independent protein translocase protein TatA
VAEFSGVIKIENSSADCEKPWIESWTPILSQLLWVLLIIFFVCFFRKQIAKLLGKVTFEFGDKKLTFEEAVNQASIGAKEREQKIEEKEAEKEAKEPTLDDAKMSTSSQDSGQLEMNVLAYLRSFDALKDYQIRLDVSVRVEKTRGRPLIVDAMFNTDTSALFVEVITSKSPTVARTILSRLGETIRGLRSKFSDLNAKAILCVDSSIKFPPIPSRDVFILYYDFNKNEAVNSVELKDFLDNLKRG